MQCIYGDFETKSGFDIKEVGRAKYLRHPEADIVVYAWRTEGMDAAEYWLPGDVLPDHLVNPQNYYHYYHNIQFDAAVQELLGAKHGMKPIPLSNQRDVMGICGRYGLPQSLDQVGQVLGIDNPKLTTGKALIKKICSPPYRYSHKDFADFVEYCKRDVDSMWEIIQVLPLPYLSDHEQRIWELTVRINQKGLPLDIEGCKIILDRAERYKNIGLLRLKEISKGQITTANQTQRIRTFLEEQYNLILPNLQAGTVDDYLEKDIPDTARELLQLRKDLGPAAVSKFKKAVTVAVDGIVYDSHRYYGAHTGRWAGMGFQVQNLPRASSKEPYKLFRQFKNESILAGSSVIIEARKLVRHMIRAPEGFLISANDYSSIENRLLAWYTDDQPTLKLFSEGGDQYKDMASFLYQVNYDLVNSAQRFMGKVIILGCGYGMGHKKFRLTAAGYGLELTEAEAHAAVQAYRKKYPRIVKMWYGLYNAALAAIRHPGKTFALYKCKFAVVNDGRWNWLKLTLANGNTLFYPEPQIDGDNYRPQWSYMGINGYTKKWDRKKVIPGLLTENVIQATAREYMAEGALALLDVSITPIALIHDEGLNLIPIETIKRLGRQGTLDFIDRTLCYPREWCPDLPMEAGGYLARRYRKD